MKIRAITLSDVRQFSRPVTVAGFDAGLNVLSAPNESGKSTLFDALHAVLFEKHGARKKEVLALQPDVGGAPTITLEIELDGKAFRIVKRWLSKPMAEVWQDGRLIAKADEAEAFIARLTTPIDEGGPAGLLWVRQGLTALDDGTDRERKWQAAARRDLMSSITGEFEALTGGRRMDRVLAEARAALAQRVTQRGARAGGPLERAQREVAEHEAKVQELRAQAEALSRDLRRRAEVRRELDLLSDPAEAAARKTRLEEARAAQDAARAHGDQLAHARLAVQSATLHRDRAAERLRAFTEARRAAHASRAAAETAAQTAAASAAAETEARAALEGAKAAAETARHAHAEAQARLQAVLAAETRAATASRRADLTRRLAEARALEPRIAAARTAAARGPDAATLTRLEQAAQALRLAEALHSAAAPHLTIRYHGPETPRARLDGTQIPEGTPRPILGPTRLDLPGYGQIEIAPGDSDGQSADRLAAAQGAQAQALAQAGADSLETARRAAKARAEAEALLHELRTEMRLLAPDGLAALQAELEPLDPGDEGAAPADLPPRAEAEAQLRTAEARRRAAEAEHDRHRPLFEAARERALRDGLARDAAAAACKAAANHLADLEHAGDSTETLSRALDAARAQLADAEARHDALAARAPDMTAVTAALTRALSVVEAAEADQARLNAELARLETGIELRAGDGVEEELADAETRLAAARPRLEAEEHEVAVLRRLVVALETAQAQARDLYFDPLMAELKPMLTLLWPGAELRFDGDSLLPSELVRDGHAESLGNLSGGTREQIALLVRLAFARLLARSGQTAPPVILDDALVFTDDDRIERMFDALHAQAADLQIIVLSCRNRAFRDLGGRKLAFAPASETDA
ncbi:AAA family ATPase [Phaeovulum vinaykumarii]|uniref:DNA repair exonuclease SbcCD ATPase subunit n=1 Tax=Phaeovulum vinaykumarii TaxID=407234 RepID=A0A1N7KPP2_9RHOB|nr:ATP-binding protein [Phaeovulum vinaykumarii]SIS63511.1 DNA repair exonuclease SbcCD ATPase subunit [Phaeovulum vinaykumarii]SOC01900.1 DNA repair exonuclease SbcCD ATPase subunit [Phaeovulum vinaykumarii]